MSLAERDQCVHSLMKSLDECRQGKGSVTLVSGSIASGKTALLHEFAEHATTSNARFLSATCSAAESDLPLGVIDQIILNARTAYGYEPGGDDGNDREPAGARALHRLCLDIADRDAERPLIIGIDDIEYIDTASRQCVLYLARRLTASPVMVVLAGSSDPQSVGWQFQAELLRQPHASAIRLASLTPAGTADVLADHLAPAETQRLAAACHQISGGNPLLVHALAEDNQSPADPSAPIEVGDAFSRALLNCLYRCDPPTLSVAQALAVLDGLPTGLPALVNMEPEQVEAILRSLQSAGLVNRGHFRHAVAQTAVLQSLDPQERRRLHLRAAVILHDIGSPATEVAGHLVAAKRVTDAWGVGVLREAAEQRLSDGDVGAALDALDLAYQASSGEHERATVKSLMAVAEWRINPSSARRHLPELSAAVQRGDLAGRPAIDLIDRLLWHGRPEDAVDLLDRLSERDRAGELDAESQAALRAIALSIAFLYPDTAEQVRPEATDGDHTDEAIPASPLSLRLQSATVRAAILADGPDSATVSHAEQILQVARLDDTTLAPITAALLALFYADRADKAAAWSAPLLAEADLRHAPTWQAIFGTLHGLVAHRQGDLAAAEQHGNTALTRISPRCWGVAIGAPLALLILAKTEMGKHDDAAELLHHPVPDAMFRTPYGLHYLHARGRHMLATKHFAAALNDFQACGELMQRWGFDLPSVVPWRSEAAQVRLAQGRGDEARRLVEEQLSMLGPGHTRARGISLRAMASITEPRQRPQLLRQAAEVLQACGDRLELARTLAALSHVKEEVGESSRARALERWAQNLAATCYAETPSTEPPGPGDGTEQHATVDGGASSLSNAERRVAELAAKGYTNREISCKLYVTVSTVEQHLTRVYRKLNVNSRADLPLGLDFDDLDFDDHTKAIA
ncbi:helix-turn-helix transcriptional regulator [Actinoplanes couchii]|uniref:HTH luxR-type domain-containing protein n=1 Tax=Actinoplanes couchii TaxID=403638 RepID=A0ABQ3XSK5_9ACTN|nr:LuxR family transcriptional regulator [Actinoplanes couchii]MDR6315968.1 DNA-binding CsgD family transcriptional regulator/N6-adenosine-specific RNA methylase IME4 [Actinoplanes couchii]GID61486.1 hypothetical protein Aco03nite_098900 [Actinoplanes couchii]